MEHLGWIDYGIFILLLTVSAAIGVYQGYMKSKQTSTSEFLIADGRMKILPTAMSLLASLTSAASLLGVPVEVYYYGTMYFYSFISWFIATFITIKIFLPKFHYIGSPSIYAYLEQRFSITMRMLVTCSYISITILYMSVILYGPGLALSQVTGLNIWVSIISCGLVCTGGMKAVIWTDVMQALIMFIGLILSMVIGLIDLGGISRVFQIVKNGNRLQFAVTTFDPSIRYTVWSILVGTSSSSIAQYACIQTQAQRYMCVKHAKAAQKVLWIHYVMAIIMQTITICVGCLLYAKYYRCDPLRSKIISRPDQLYPLFVIETLGRFPGLTGLFISCILSATLSTFSSGVNSTATVIVEDIYKPLFKTQNIPNRQQVIVSKLLSITVGCLTVLMALVVSFMRSNMITIIMQIFGAIAAPILGIYLLGLFSARVKSRSVLAAFLFCLTFQLFVLFGSIFTVKPINKQGGRLPTSIEGCLHPVNTTISLTTDVRSSIWVSLFSMSPLWFTFNGTLITIIVSLILTRFLDSHDSNVIDKSLLVSFNDVLPCFSSKSETTKPIKTENETSTTESTHEQESML